MLFIRSVQKRKTLCNMGNLFGRLKVNLHTDTGSAPVKHDRTCYTKLRFQKALSVYIGECARNGTYVINSVDGADVGSFKGCPSSMTFQAPAELVDGKEKDSTVRGTCHDAPINLSNTIWRIIIVSICVVVFGSLFMFGILLIYNHKDSSNTSITSTHHK